MQAWCSLQVKLCDPCLSALKWFVYNGRRYTSALLYLYEKNIVFWTKLSFEQSLKAAEDSQHWHTTIDDAANARDVVLENTFKYRCVSK